MCVHVSCGHVSSLSTLPGGQEAEVSAGAGRKSLSTTSNSSGGGDSVPAGRRSSAQPPTFQTCPILLKEATKVCAKFVQKDAELAVAGSANDLVAVLSSLEAGKSSMC